MWGCPVADTPRETYQGLDPANCCPRCTFGPGFKYSPNVHSEWCALYVPPVPALPFPRAAAVAVDAEDLLGMQKANAAALDMPLQEYLTEGPTRVELAISFEPGDGSFSVARKTGTGWESVPDHPLVTGVPLDCQGVPPSGKGKASL